MGSSQTMRNVRSLYAGRFLLVTCGPGRWGIVRSTSPGDVAIVLHNRDHQSPLLFPILLKPGLPAAEGKKRGVTSVP